MAALQPVRGTHDLLPEDFRRHNHVADTARDIAFAYGYDPVQTPIFEFTQVFKRTLGDTSDVVTKEMYTFTDKGDEEITLRPENTAGVCRAFMSNGLAQNIPVRYFYAGPMFRYEKPQKGRMRQFHQIGVELIGAAQPLGDIEVIACGSAILDGLGLKGRTVLELNTLGDVESRTAYRTALVAYFEQHKGALSEESIARLDRNPMRILDSKDQGDRAIVADAPLYTDFLNEESTAFFATVKDCLDRLGIAYTLNPRLVRGLDYYCHTAFEFTTTDLGSQGTVMAGGRYDGLMQMMGGQPTPGVGWAAGIERLSMLASEPPAPARPIAFVPLGEAAEKAAFAIVDQLRREGLRVDIAFSGNMKKRMKRSDKIDARVALFLGDDELAGNTIQVKDLDASVQTQVSLDGLSAYLKDLTSGNE